MESMIIIENTLVSEDLVQSYFCCNLAECKGWCCVDGDAGAPLEPQEIEEIKKQLAHIKPYMSPEGITTMELEGISTRDITGGIVTTLNPGKECVFTFFKNGIAFCAIEKAFLDGKLSFQKPVSCHLYPVRVNRYETFDAVNVHQWHVCAQAWKEGQEKGIPLYRYLKVPLIRKYGEEWYKQLEAAAEHLSAGSGD